MKTKTLSGLLLIIGIAIFTSCSVEKRQYTTGYYIDWKNNKTASEHNSNAGIKKENRDVVINSIAIETEAPAITDPSCTDDNELTIKSVKNDVLVNHTKQIILPAKEKITIPLQAILHPGSFIKSMKAANPSGGGDPSRNWAAITGFVLCFICPLIGIWFSIYGMKSERRGLAFAGYIISLIWLVAVVVAISAGSGSSD